MMTRKNNKHSKENTIKIDTKSNPELLEITKQDQKQDQKHQKQGPLKLRRRKVRTIKRKLGKNGNKVLVLIKNNDTRKRIENECKDLKQEQMSDVRIYLKKHNLLKSGSVAPNEVLKATYVEAIKAGEVTNNNAETLIHNYHNDN